MSDESTPSATPFLRTIGESATNLCRWCRQPMEYGECRDRTKWWVCVTCDNTGGGVCPKDSQTEAN